MDFKIRAMKSTDVSAAMSLKEAAGWNQVPDDWLCYLELEPSGCFVGEVDDQIVASATALSYATSFGWIGMILVAPNFRRKGYATRMMEASLEYLEGKQCNIQRLDATEAGAQVYRKFGFSQEAIVERWVRQARRRSPNAAQDSAVDPFPITAQHVSELANWDAAAFGAVRERLLQWYVRNSSPSLQLRNGSNPGGYVMGRAGSAAHQLGPLVAQDYTTASLLARRFLNQIPDQPVIADVSRDNPAAIELLEQLDFAPSRRLIRMFRGAAPPAGRRERVYFLAGFEFG